VQFCREQNIMAQGRGLAHCRRVSAGHHRCRSAALSHALRTVLTDGRRNCWPDIDIDLQRRPARGGIQEFTAVTAGAAPMTANVITYRGRSAAREVGRC
jgi:error-prone DNA polymerase